MWASALAAEKCGMSALDWKDFERRGGCLAVCEFILNRALFEETQCPDGSGLYSKSLSDFVSKCFHFLRPARVQYCRQLLEAFHWRDVASSPVLATARARRHFDYPPLRDQLTALFSSCSGNTLAPSCSNYEHNACCVGTVVSVAKRRMFLRTCGMQSLS